MTEPDVPSTTGTSRGTGGDGWVIRVDRSTRALTVSDGCLVSVDSLTGFVAGDVVSARASSSDGVSLLAPAIVLTSLETDADHAVSDLRGQFVVALSDARDRRTRVLRDPVGSHPLFYTERPDAVLFAARPEVLLGQPGVSRTLNRVAIADHLCKRWPDDHETFFADIRRVPPGWQMVFSASGVTSGPYWHATSDARQISWLPDEEVARFDALLDRAVRRALNHRRAGIFLSGGFDSVSVAAVARDVTRHEGLATPVGLSLGFPDPTCDERPVQRSVAERLGLPLELIDFHDAVGPSGLLAAGLALNARLDAPLFNNWMPAYLALAARGRAAGVDTIITGEGGDEWLGTTPFLAADLWRRGDVAGLVRLARTWKRSYPQSWPQVIGGVTWRYGLRPLAGLVCHAIAPVAWNARRARRVVQAIPPWISTDAALRAQQYDRAFHQLADANPPGGFYNRESRMVLGHSLTSWQFEEQFTVASPLGIRYVHPYWDADLIAHVYRVHPNRLNDGNRTKALVRQTVNRRFPALGFERQRKVGALDFFSGLVRREAPRLAAQVADFKGLASLDIVEPVRLRSYLDQAWRGTPWHLGAAWNIVNMEVWIRTQLK